MKIGIILNTNDAETCWNCFRFGNEAISKNHSMKVFLLGRGVEAESVKDARFPLLKGAIKRFVKNKGVILACGTCLKIRGREGSDICPVSSMGELLQLVEESDRILTFC
ncbi:MAG TPA: DsrE family protein [Candidatus Nanoarchaeia archaeon]|nr:DsrE family protein [Candidatus Nanoarchaeia archaeon]